MYVSSKLLNCRVLAVALAIGLWAIGIPSLQAAGRQQTSCPLDPHAQHEAREACERKQDAYAHALHEVEEAQERLTHKLEKARAVESGMCYASEPGAESKSIYESDLIRTKPAGVSEPQYVGPTANIFGLTVADIYDRGIMVTDVDLGSLLGQLGIRRGDVILTVNGEPVLNTNDFQKFLQQLVGKPVSLEVSRLGEVNVFMM